EGRWGEALRDVDQAAEVLRQSSGVTAATQQALLSALITVNQMGRYDELARRCEQALAWARATGNRYVDDYLQSPLAIQQLMAGDADGARARLAAVVARAAPGDTVIAGALFWACACDLYQGRSGDALARLASAERGLAALHLSRHPMLRASRLIAQLGVAL